MRMLLTILSWDIAGSCDLLSTLTLETYCQVIRDAQEEAADTVEAHGGFVARFMGDGLLAYFGFPAPSDDDQERAVRAALALPLRWRQAGISLRARAAIASGPVIVGPSIGRLSAREIPAFGEAPSLAARLLDIASPETVVLDAATRTALGGMFALQPICDLALKGFPHVRRAWRVAAQPNAGHAGLVNHGSARAYEGA